MKNSGKMVIFSLLSSQNYKFWSKINSEFGVFARIRSLLACLIMILGQFGVFGGCLQLVPALVQA